MKQLVIRIGIWGIGLALTLLVGWEMYEWLHAQRYPRETVAESYLKNRLGEMTSDQERLVRHAIDHDFLLAMLVATSAQNRGQPPWDALGQITKQSPTPVLAIQKQALSAGMEGKIKKDDAARFVDSSLAVWTILNDADPPEAERFLKQIEACSPEEYFNVAVDPSYTLITSRLDPKYRAVFRRYQQVLTPLLAMASVDEWDRLLAAFQVAQPRVAEILEDSKLGRTYGLVYMLQFELVQELEQSGVPEKDAIEFVGVNAANIRAVQKGNWTVCVDRLEKTNAPNGKSLFRAACADPAVFWLVSHDHSDGNSHSLQILQRYAGTELPAILLKYGQDQKLLDAAIEALLKFDNDLDPSPTKRQVAAKFLSRYQDDEAFKDSLVKHGAILIPALSAGGPDALAKIRINPNDIYKLVDKDGQRKGTPLWTFIPGGNIVYAVNEKLNGRTLTWGELGWATVDAVLVVPLAGTAAVGAKALLNGEKVASEGLVKASTEAASKEAEEIIVEGAGKSAGQFVVESVATTARVGAAVESRSLLRSAGVKLAAGFGETISSAVRIAKTYPIRTGAATVAVLWVVSPQFQNLVKDKLGGAAHLTGTIMASVPGNLIEGMWDEVQQLSQKTPMLAPVFYALLAALILAVVMLPIYLLKKLLHPIYAFIVAPLWSSARRVTAALTSMGKGVPRTLSR